MTDSLPTLPTHSRASPLLRAARGGAADAREQLLELYRRYLVALADEQIGGKLRRKVAPSDAAQETFVRAIRFFDNFQEGSVREWEAWLRTLALNTIADLRRRFSRQKRNIAREQPLDDVDSRAFLKKLSTLGAGPIDRALEDREMAQRVLMVVSKLRPSHQAVILWCFRDGLTLDEIATKLNRSVDAVRMLLNRAVAALQELMRSADEF